MSMTGNATALTACGGQAVGTSPEDTLALKARYDLCAKCQRQRLVPSCFYLTRESHYCLCVSHDMTVQRIAGITRSFTIFGYRRQPAARATPDAPSMLASLLLPLPAGPRSRRITTGQYRAVRPVLGP
jgi:hypothetical protein